MTPDESENETAAAGPTPVVLNIDVEPDPTTFDPSQPPACLGFERLVAAMPALREQLAEATGAEANFDWFLRMDPQIEATWGRPTWLAERYADELAALVDAGDEIGLHTHVWRWDQSRGDWINDFEDHQWGVHCLETGLDAFATHFGRPPGAHRAGNGALTPAMFARLGRAGVRMDFTVEPGLRPLTQALSPEPIRGVPPDYRGIPTRPYRSSESAYPRPDPGSRSDPLLVPMFSAPNARRPWRLTSIYPTQRSWLFRPRLRLGLLPSHPPVVTTTTRSNISIGPEWQTAVGNLGRLAKQPGLAFVTASTALAQLTEARAA